MPLTAQINTQNQDVFGFVGCAGSGKTASALHLEKLGFTRIRFADTLKLMLSSLYTAAGVDQGMIARM